LDDVLHPAARTAAIVQASDVCFEMGRDRFVGLLDALEDATPKTVQRSGTAAMGLPALEACVDDRALALQPPAPTEEVRDRAEAVRVRIARAHSLEALGDYEGGKQLALDILIDAKALGWAPLHVQALDVAGVLLERVAEYEAAYEHHLEGFKIAATAGFDQQAANAAAQLVFVVGDRLERKAEGEAWGEVAAAMLTRVGDADGLHMGNLLGRLGSIRQKAGDLDAALDAHERGMALRRQALGERHPMTAYTIANLANVHYARREHARARELHEQALEIQLEVLGEMHPDLGATYNNLAAISSRLEDLPKAIEFGRKAFEIAEGTLGANHPLTAMTLSNLGSTLRRAGRHDEALPLLERSLRIREQVFGPDKPQVVASLNHMGVLHLDLGDWRTARPLLERALRIRVATGAKGEPLGQAQWNVAKSYGEQDPARARQLGAEAIATYRDAGVEDGVADVEAWLASLDAPESASPNP
jgi:tetratricopeptide (TPR) repeat protein